ncbi:cytochrome c biogenesis protein CcdA [Candidatus Woesearchaeota archaeon]|nr:cytochrome c biogenesis protein CcdA [Candidatus Woesearchaeota archaeon]
MKPKSLFLLFFSLFIVFIAGIFVYVYSMNGVASLNAVTSLRNVSFIIAFLAGILSIFSPCTVAVLPSFIAYTFKEKREIAKMTGIFFLGFSASFIALGLLIAYLGKVSFVYFQNDSSLVIQVIGLILVFFGIMTFLGKGFTFLNFGIKPRHDFPGTFLFGMLFAVGWSACSGPVISGILSIAASFNDYTSAALLLFFYSLGIAIPLFVMAFAFDTYNLAENRLIRGKQFNFRMLGHEFIIHTTTAISGLMLIGLGVLFIAYKGTTVLTTADLFGRLIVFSIILLAAYLVYKAAITRVFTGSNARHIAFAALLMLSVAAFSYIDSHYVITTVGFAEDFDRLLLQNTQLFNIIGAAMLILFAALVWKFLLKRANIIY